MRRRLIRHCATKVVGVGSGSVGGAWVLPWFNHWCIDLKNLACMCVCIYYLFLCVSKGFNRKESRVASLRRRRRRKSRKTRGRQGYEEGRKGWLVTYKRRTIRERDEDEREREGGHTKKKLLPSTRIILGLTLSLSQSSSTTLSSSSSSSFSTTNTT